MRVLIVDDLEPNLYLLRVLLLNAGYEVLEAENGEVALEVAANNEVDLVVSDILMPTMDGFEFCRIWKSSEKLKKIPFIFYTATYTEQKDREFALNIGADLFLIKPMESYNLLREIDKVIKNHQVTSSASLVGNEPNEDDSYYKKYSSRLVKKLEEKSLQLEHKNNELMKRDSTLRELNDSLSFQLSKVKITESNLRRHEGELLSIVNNMAEGVMTTDHQGIIYEFNPAAEKIFGYSRKEIVGETIEKLIPHSFRQKHTGYMKDFVDSESDQIRAREMRAINKDDEEVYLRLSVSRLPYGKLNKSMFISTFMDVTKEKQQEEVILRSHKMEAIGTLSGGIAHDFNNMLGVILGYAEVMLLNQNDSKTDSYIKNIQQAAERGVSLTRKLLSFSKKHTELTSILNLNDVINNNLEIISKILLNKVDLSLELEDVPYIQIDKNEFEDCLLNLCINAVHAMPDGGKLKVKTKTTFLEPNNLLNLDSGTYLHFSLEDTGCGMTKSVVENIFAPFFTTKGNKGTGLGLSQVYGFVKRSKGLVNVDSVLDKGTTFNFYFPASSVTNSHSKKESASQNKSICNDGVILIVDDEEVLLELTKTRLEEMGCEVVTAIDAEAALAVLKKNQNINLLLSDVIMPDIDGYELVSIARDLYPQLKVLLMSGYNDLENTDYYCLQKPFSNIELGDAIAKALL